MNIELLGVDGTYGEYAAIYAAYTMTDYEDIFLLSHSCEIKNVKLFDIVFEKYKNKSVAISYMKGYLPFHAWECYLGKYRRCILDKLDLLYYCPSNLIEVGLGETFVINMT